MKETIIININSFVDVITNSSTELFVCDTEKSLKVVETLVNEIQNKYPNEYGNRLSVEIIDSEDPRLNEIFEEIYDCYDIDEKKAVKFLEARGYKIEEPDNKKPKYIEISAERGGLDPRVKSFIEENFNVIHYTTEA